MLAFGHNPFVYVVHYFLARTLYSGASAVGVPVPILFGCSLVLSVLLWRRVRGRV